MIRIFAFVLACIASTANGASDANALWQATEAEKISVELHASAPSEAFKKTLLDHARAEDRDYVKRMIINWKTNSTDAVRSEFNLLIFRDAKGADVLRMVPVENEAGKFRINGKIWGTPQRGSIAKSLEKFLDVDGTSRKSAALLFLSLGDFAEADERTVRLIDIAYLYASLLHSHPSAGANLWASITSRPVEINCSLERASGRVKILNQVFNFSSASDGTVAVMPNNEDSPAAFQASIQNGELVYSPCIDSKCGDVSSIQKTSLKAFMKFPKLDDVEVATTFRPRDQKWAIEYRDRANRAMYLARSRGEDVIRALSPLAACCRQRECESTLALNRIRLIQSEIQSARTSN